MFISLFASTAVHSAQLSIIIDDIGYRQSDEAVLSLPANITLSVLPHTPLGARLASQAYAKGHEIMLHLPMQALNGKALGDGGLTNVMNEQELKAQVQAAMESIPFAKGANNHMGSFLTQLDQPMLWVMESLKQKQFYFIDSMTTKFTKAGEKAELLNVPWLRRDLFLDNDVSHAALEKQFRLMIEQTLDKGYFVAIAHPYPETMKYLKANLNRLEKAGITLVPTSSLVSVQLAIQKEISRAATQE